MSWAPLDYFVLFFDCIMKKPNISVCLVLSRQVDDSVSVEEIDVLQMDLETLLAAATSRMRQLQTEIQILSDMGESTKKEKKVQCFTNAFNFDSHYYPCIYSYIFTSERF